MKINTTRDKTMWKKFVKPIALGFLALQVGFSANANPKYGPGVTDTEIKLGQTVPYSGPAASFGTIGRVQQAYLRMINEQGGVNGRKITLISLDDAYSPPLAVSQVRRLVEKDGVLAIFDIVGTPTNAAVQQYLNQRKVPQLFPGSGATRFSDPKRYPWTIGWNPNYVTEGREAANYMLRLKPDAKIAVLHPNDDIGKDLLKGVNEALAKQGRKLTAVRTYETSDASVDNQVLSLSSSGADVFMNLATAKFAAQAIRKAYDIGWKPLQYLSSSSPSISGVLVPAGVEKAVGIITAAYMQDPNDPEFQKTAEYRNYLDFMKKYYPEGDPADQNNGLGIAFVQTLIQVLKQCGDDLTRENVMRQAANLKDLQLPNVIKGLLINTGPDDYQAIEGIRFRKFNGESWQAIVD